MHVAVFFIRLAAVFTVAFENGDMLFFKKK